MPNGTLATYTPSQNHVGVNLTYTKFLFVQVRDDEAIGAKLRTAGSSIARGFFNDFDADGTRDIQAHETIQFFVSDRRTDAEGLAAARYLVQVSGKYRPRLQEVELELRRRLGDAGDVVSLDGAHRNPRYTSAELYEQAYRRAQARQSGRQAKNVFILPMNKTGEWWQMSALDRHAYFYPHVDGKTGPAGAWARPHRRRGRADALPPPVPQPGRLRAEGRVRLHHLLRVCGRTHRRLRPGASGAARHLEEPRVGVRGGRSALARHTASALVGGVWFR